MKRKIYFILFSLVLSSCSKDDDSSFDNTNTINIYDYSFNFPPEFQHNVLQGIDSYVGEVTSTNTTLNYDFGIYAGGPNNLYTNENFEVRRDTIDGHLRQIVKAKNPKTHRSSVNFYRVEPYDFGYSGNSSTWVALVMWVNGEISAEQQELVIKALQTGRPTNYLNFSK